MANFGLEQLRLADPRDGWPNEKARTAASGANFIIDAACAYDGLKAAVGDLNWVCATTARQRDLVKPILTPVAAVAEMRRRIAAGQSCGVLFGPERNGLEAELDRAGFFSAPEKRQSVVQNMRAMFTRMGATQQEIRTLRGIVKALVGRRRSRRLPP